MPWVQNTNINCIAIFDEWKHGNAHGSRWKETGKSGGEREKQAVFGLELEPWKLGVWQRPCRSGTTMGNSKRKMQNVTTAGRNRSRNGAKSG